MLVRFNHYRGLLQLAASRLTWLIARLVYIPTTFLTTEQYTDEFAPPNHHLFGEDIQQIYWISTCTGLKTLRTYNINSITFEDETFLYQLPQNFSQLKWTLTGKISFSRATCIALGFSYICNFPEPILSPISHMGATNEDAHPLNIRTVDLDNVVVEKWREAIYKDAEGTEELQLKFELNSYFRY
jgi:hypothetical protein